MPAGRDHRDHADAGEEDPNAMTEHERPLAQYHERIPDEYRSRGWRVQFIAISSGEAQGGIGPTLYKARLTNGARGNARYVDSDFLISREDAVDEAVRDLIAMTEA